VPLAWSKAGVPIGVQFVGRFGEEHLLLQLAAQGEGQDDDGETGCALFLQCGSIRRWLRTYCAGLDCIDAHWASDVLEVLLPEINKAFPDPITYLAVGVVGKTDTPRISNPFEARCNIDAVAHHVTIAFRDHIAEMNADAELDATLGRKPRIALDHAVLHLNGAADGIDHASELDENPISRAVDDTSVMQGDGGIDQIAAERPPSTTDMSIRLIEPVERETAWVDGGGSKEK